MEKLLAKLFIKFILRKRAESIIQITKDGVDYMAYIAKKTNPDMYQKNMMSLFYSNSESKRWKEASIDARNEI